VPVLSLAELPKGARAPPARCAAPELALTRVAGAGSRKVVSALGKSALLFWYRDALYATEPRSPAEGAYSQGFLTARFTQARTRTRTRAGSSQCFTHPRRSLALYRR